MNVCSVTNSKFVRSLKETQRRASFGDGTPLGDLVYINPEAPYSEGACENAREWNRAALFFIGMVRAFTADVFPNPTFKRVSQLFRVQGYLAGVRQAFGNRKAPAVITAYRFEQFRSKQERVELQDSENINLHLAADLKCTARVGEL